MVALTRIGIVDMGSNAIRFLVAEVTGSASGVLESHRLPVRLGQEVFHTGQIPEAAIADTVDAFRRFRATCDRLGVAHVRAIATSAMRDARNRDLLVDRVRAASGIEIEVISGTQEAYLLKLGVESQIELAHGRSLLIDVGGGSVELVLVENGEVTSADSYRLGALRMLETMRNAGVTDAGRDGSFVEVVLDHLKGLDHRIAERIDEGPVDRYVAVGGNIDALADLVASRVGPRKHGAVDTCSLDDVEREVLALAQLPIDERISRFGLRPDRADTIVAAGLVYVHLGQLARVPQVLVPRTGIKEGLLVEVARGHVASFAAADHVAAVLGACRAMGRRYHYEATHAESVLRLAQQLFDQTRSLHGLDDRARVLLEAAALLHDVGVAVNNDGHHKHSQYLIEATDLVGLGEEDRHLVALLARFHRKSPPSRDHAECAALRRRERTMLERLAALLRLADALDRQHAGLVRGVHVTVVGATLELRPVLPPGSRTRLTLEQQAVTQKGALFAQLFGVEPRLIPA